MKERDVVEVIDIEIKNQFNSTTSITHRFLTPKDSRLCYLINSAQTLTQVSVISLVQ